MGLVKLATAAIAGVLGQDQTNGASTLGTFSALSLPSFLTSNPLLGGYPWGSMTVNGTNPYSGYPTTGVIRTYDFTISRSFIAPDGYERPVLLVNGAFPGPTIESNWGDTIQVTVHNNITGPEEGTGIHWHGFLQHGTPWEDGVPAVSQCPIAPGTSLTYQFQATLYGTSWYHSHYSAQYSGGIVGPIVVYGPNDNDYDIDVGPIMLSDWYHRDYFDIIKDLLAPGGDPVVYSDNNLIQGKANFDCSTKAKGDNTKCTDNAGLARFKFTTGKTHRLRLINSGSEGVQRFSIDGHSLTVIAYDYVPIQPYTTKVVTLGVGQRGDVLVKADAGASGSAFWMRSSISKCSPAHQPDALAVVYYDTDTGAAPTSQAWNEPDPGTCANDDLSLTRPAFPMALPPPSWTHEFNIGMYRNASNVALWTFDGVSFRGDYNVPTFLQANEGNATFDPEWNVRNLYTNSSVRMIVNNNSPSSHPMHLHGFNFYVLHEGPGKWDGTIVNADNPMRRDVELVRAHGHVVLQFDAADNPGLWAFHCHIPWHSSAGFFEQFIAVPDVVRQFRVPDTIANTCRDWDAWTRSHVPDQLDSGV